MKKIIVVLIAVLLPVATSATIRNITSLPYTTQANGDTLRLSGTRLVSSTSGITVAHSNILIDG